MSAVLSRVLAGDASRRRMLAAPPCDSKACMVLTRLLLGLVLAAAVAAGNFFFVTDEALAWRLGAPFALALVVALLPARRAAPPAREPVAPPPPPPAEPAGAEALGLLGLLQEEGRFVDFVTEDLARYPDEQIGAAVRGIHEGCRKVLDERVAFEPVLPAADGEMVTIEAGFDPAAIRLTGNVSGEPPFRGVLRHAGWRVTRASFPARRARDPHLIAPAGRTLRVFEVPQLVAPGEMGARPTLPSFLYLAGAHELPAGSLDPPWAAGRAWCVGLFAREQGARVPARLVASSKSWLCHAAVDRTAAILPWGAGDEVPKVSPVEASARTLTHLREAWDASFPAPLAEQDVVLTVPASF